VRLSVLSFGGTQKRQVDLRDINSGLPIIRHDGVTLASVLELSGESHS
jgi:hypothetical protein